MNNEELAKFHESEAERLQTLAKQLIEEFALHFTKVSPIVIERPKVKKTLTPTNCKVDNELFQILREPVRTAITTSSTSLTSPDVARMIIAEGLFKLGNTELEVYCATVTEVLHTLAQEFELEIETRETGRVYRKRTHPQRE